MNAPLLKLDRNICSDFDAATSREWLETNGLGGFASSTVAGLNSRRYHGLLTAATRPPVGRMLLLSKLEETLVIDEQRYEISANQYSGAVHPRGFEFLAEFRLDPFPVWTYEVRGVRITKTLFMIQGENSVAVEYGIEGGTGCTLEVRPLIAFRDYHATTHENDAVNKRAESSAGLVSIEPYAGLPALHFAHNADQIEQLGFWYYGFEYTAERERGLDCQEDLFNPFVLRFQGRKRAALIASTEPHAIKDFARLRKEELRRRAAALPAPLKATDTLATLASTADQFIVDRDGLKSIVAGYHWFGDWGRDTMVALPGLTLATGKPEIAKGILLAFAAHVSQGMLPNRFPDAGEAPEYNTVDATLWYFEAVRAYVDYTGDLALVEQKLYAILKDILDWHIRGTRYGIRVDADGLLRAGEPGVQLTWMDAKIGDWVVTPRHGKPVEIQALWYNALRVFETFAAAVGDESSRIFTHEMADLAKKSFNAKFWNGAGEFLFDVVDGQMCDSSIRPNQIFAASLHHAVLEPARSVAMLATVERELLAPMGLRTLSPRDPRYRPRYQGGVWERDSAYHEGTVWPWLLGPFITAYVKAHARSAESRARAAKWLEGLMQHLHTAGLNQIPEIADAEAPHTPRGCIAQAWSVGELLRAAVEDVYELRPARLKAKAA